MVFEPTFVQAQPGNTITFMPTDRDHNAPTLKDLVTRGVGPLRVGTGEEISITVNAEGLNGGQCTPDMDMVSPSQVGASTNLGAAQAVAEVLRRARGGLRGAARAVMTLAG